MTGTCRLNNKNLRNYRRTPEYQAVMVDLALLGVISKEECEMILGSGIPAGLVLPDGKSALISEKDLPESEFVETEPEQTEQTEGQETGDETPVDTQEVVSDGVTTDNVDSVNPEPIPGVIVMPGDETPEVTDDEGRTESDN